MEEGRTRHIDQDLPRSYTGTNSRRRIAADNPVRRPVRSASSRTGGGRLGGRATPLRTGRLSTGRGQPDSYAEKSGRPSTVTTENPTIGA
ncbi:hypothetical protein UK99_08605 [Frankia casuarinae]|uniref:Uncharacterized protein n=1 Tax=Frankia casuarinae (strain DSM 45818 / CECT 9043 / HFP020203 / CcI3) TaxID=106370 RepID=Q2J9F8_FRACC|nr:hypothetical protein Francci3_2724 [Frankia casuarinae]OFB43523.1 hypothetical protein Manayef4_11895 [Frankia sp. CgIM4]OHV51397.1 hypothetical protein CgIS1_18930 [Frankia sp. CgIS1]ORT96623.1 hypothetical protein UK99_08605 [Frankia casuarinae]